MLQQTNKKILTLGAILAMVIAVSGALALAIPQIANFATGSSLLPHEKTTTSDGSSGGIQVSKEMRTIGNTHCVNHPGGPQIC